MSDTDEPGQTHLTEQQLARLSPEVRATYDGLDDSLRVILIGRIRSWEIDWLPVDVATIRIGPENAARGVWLFGSAVSCNVAVAAPPACPRDLLRLAEIEEVVNEAVRFADQSPDPPPEALFNHVYKENT